MFCFCVTVLYFDVLFLCSKFFFLYIVPGAEFENL